MRDIKALRWTTRRDLCQQLLTLLSTTADSRWPLAWLLRHLADPSFHPDLRRLALDITEPDPLVRDHALQALPRDALSEEDIADLLDEFIDRVDQPGVQWLGDFQIRRLFSMTDHPERHLFRLERLTRVGLQRLLLGSWRQKMVRPLLVKQWLAVAEPDQAKDVDYTCFLQRFPGVLQWLVAAPVIPSATHLRILLSGRSPETLERIFEQAPHWRTPAEAMFCLPPAATGKTRDELLLDIQARLMTERGVHLSPIARNAWELLLKLNALDEAASWSALHPRIQERLKSRQQTESTGRFHRSHLALREAGVPAAATGLRSPHPADRYLAIARLAELGGHPRLARIAASDPHALVRIAAAGACGEHGWLLRLAEEADHVCVRAEAIRWLGHLGGHDTLLCTALRGDTERWRRYHQPVQVEAAVALRNSTDPAVGPVLLQAALRDAGDDASIALAILKRWLDGRTWTPGERGWRRLVLCEPMRPSRLSPVPSAPAASRT